MTYNEETYILNTLKELKERIRDMPIEQIAKEVHENNVMLKAIIKYLARENINAASENENDFGRNILANMISNVLDFNK